MMQFINKHKSLSIEDTVITINILGKVLIREIMSIKSYLKIID